MQLCLYYINALFRDYFTSDHCDYLIFRRHNWRCLSVLLIGGECTLVGDVWREWARRYESHGTWSARDTHAKRRRRQLNQANTARNANTRYARQNALAQSTSDLIVRTQDARSPSVIPHSGERRASCRVYPRHHRRHRCCHFACTPYFPFFFPVIRLPSQHPPVLIIRLSRPRASLNAPGDKLFTEARSCE